MMDRDGLVARIDDVLRADERVRAAWLTGSLGRGTADRYSDVDAFLVVADGERDAFAASWKDTAALISPTVLLLRLDAPNAVVFNHVTPDWLRFDIVIGSPADVARRSRSTHRLLFDRDGLDGCLLPHGDPLPPSAARVESLSREFLRVLGLLPVVIGREEYVVAASGSGLLRQLLWQLMLEDVAVEDRGGALRLGPLLPPARLQILQELPPIEATRESAIAVHLACAQAFLPLARELAGWTGVAWPEDLEAAARGHIRRELAIEF